MSVLLGYFDPGSGSLLVQAFVGGTAGLIVLVRYLWDSAPSLWHSSKRWNDTPLNESKQG